jgi:cell division cycle 14
MGDITDDEVFQPIEIIPGRLTFCPQQAPPSSTEDHFYYTVDTDPTFRYRWEGKSLGPPTLSQVHRFYHLTFDILANHPEPVTLYCYDNAYRFTMAISLLCTFQMLYLHRTPDQSFEPFRSLAPCLIPFTGGCGTGSTHSISVLTCLRAFQKAITLNWYSTDNFDPDSYDFYSCPGQGDMNWIVPNKLIAFATPYMARKLGDGSRVNHPCDFIKPFKEMRVTRIVRLNDRLYDERIFARAGFQFAELPFPDGAVPSTKIIDEFMRLFGHPGVIAVHCQAGLGRTYAFAF